MSGCRLCGSPIDIWSRAKAILEEVAREHQVPLEQMISPSRKGYLVSARVCAMRQLREAGFKLEAIGLVLGRHHSTVIHHLNGHGRKKPCDG